MAQIHPLACVDARAELADDIVVGPFCVIEADVQVGVGCVLESHVVLKSGLRMGDRNHIGNGAVLGSDPQDKKFHGENTLLIIGNDNNIREYVTMHRASGEGMATRIGNDNFLMGFCHFGHNVTVEDHVTMANNVGLAGHVTIESYVTVGGMTGIHQFCRVGKSAMVGAMSRINRDVPPYMLVEGESQMVHDINAVGLRRIGIKPDARLALHKACKLLFKSQLGLRNAMEIVRHEVPVTPEIEYLLAFEERRYGGKNGRGDQR